MKPTVKTISKKIIRVNLQWSDILWIVLTGSVSGALFYWHQTVDVDHGPVGYLFLCIILFFGIIKLHESRNDLPVSTAVMADGPVMKLTGWCLKDRRGDHRFPNLRIYATALCKFFGNTLLGSLGTEVVALKTVFKPALAFLHHIMKGSLRTAEISEYLNG